MCVFVREREIKTKTERFGEAHTHLSVSAVDVSVWMCVWVICAKTDLGPEVTLLCAPVAHMD